MQSIQVKSTVYDASASVWPDVAARAIVRGVVVFALLVLVPLSAAADRHV